MIDVFFALLILTASTSFSKSRMPDNFDSKCESQIAEKIRELNASEQWVRVVDSKPNHKTFRAPTKTLGEWVEVAAGDSPSVYLITPKGIREFGWNGKNCEINKSTAFEPDKNYINVAGPVFSDADLKKALNKKESVIIYTYSPVMTYSVKYIDEMADVAKKIGFKFVPLLDPTIKVDELLKVFPNKRNYKIQKAASVEILMRQMLTHFPASVVLYNGKILDPYIFGVMTKDEFESQVTQRVMNSHGVTN